MASPHLDKYARFLRRKDMQKLIDALRAERGIKPRPALAVNARTGLPMLPAPGELILRRPNEE